MTNVESNVVIDGVYAIVVSRQHRPDTHAKVTFNAPVDICVSCDVITDVILCIDHNSGDDMLKKAYDAAYASVKEDVLAIPGMIRVLPQTGYGLPRVDLPTQEEAERTPNMVHFGGVSVQVSPHLHYAGIINYMFHIVRVKDYRMMGFINRTDIKRQLFVVAGVIHPSNGVTAKQVDLLCDIWVSSGSSDEPAKEWANNILRELTNEYPSIYGPTATFSVRSYVSSRDYTTSDLFGPDSRKYTIIIS